MYCASGAKVDKVYFDATERLDNVVVKSDWEFVYSGGVSGLIIKLDTCFRSWKRNYWPESKTLCNGEFAIIERN